MVQGSSASAGIVRRGGRTGSAGAGAGANSAQPLISIVQNAKAISSKGLVRIGSSPDLRGKDDGHGVGRADLCMSGVASSEGVVRAGGLDAAPGGVGAGVRGRLLGAIGAGLGAVQRVEPEAEAVQRADDQQSESREQEQGAEAAEGRGEVEGPGQGFQATALRCAHQAATSKVGQALTHSPGVTLPSPFRSGDRSRWPQILARG